MNIDIKCPQCDTLFGKEIKVQNDTESMLTIKNRDLYRTFRPGEGGVVMGPCRGCGITVTWPKRN